MRLRNKKTGRTHVLSEDLYIEYTQGSRIEARIVLNGGYMSYYYNSLAELNADWEDVEESLIKDENIRKAIRTWATAAGIKTDEIKISKGTFFTHIIGWLDGLVGGVEIGFRTGDAFEDIKDGAEVTLAELCGEDEE